MFFVDFFLALLIAVLLGSIFCTGCRGHRVGSVFFGFVLILFFTTWAAAVWIPPFGPLLWGTPFFSFLFLGLLFALLISALTPPARPPETPGEAIEQIRQERAADEVFNVFFWILVVFLGIVIAVRYLS